MLPREITYSVPVLSYSDHHGALGLGYTSVIQLPMFVCIFRQGRLGISNVFPSISKICQLKINRVPSCVLKILKIVTEIKPKSTEVGKKTAGLDSPPPRPLFTTPNFGLFRGICTDTQGKSRKNRTEARSSSAQVLQTDYFRCIWTRAAFPFL